MQNRYTFGNAWRLGIATFKAQYWRLALIALVAVLLASVCVLPFPIASAVIGKPTEGSDPPGGAAAVWCFSQVLAGLVGFPLIVGMGYASAQAARGRLRIADLFMGFRRFANSLGVMALLLGAYALCFFAIGLVCISLSLAAPILSRIAPGYEMLVHALAIVVGCVLGAVALSQLLMRMMPAAVIAVEPSMGPLGVLTSVDRSMAATKGVGWSLLGLAITASPPAIAWLAAARMIRLYEVDETTRRAIAIALVASWVLLIAPLMCSVYGAMYALLIPAERKAPTPAA